MKIKQQSTLSELTVPNFNPLDCNLTVFNLQKTPYFFFIKHKI